MFRLIVVLSCLLLSFAGVSPACAAEDNGDAAFDNSPDANIARVQAHVGELEEQIRALRGSIEKLTFENQQLKTQLEKSNADIAFRVDALEKKSTPVAPAPAPAPDSSQLQPVQPVTGETQAEDIPGSKGEVTNDKKFNSSRDLYNAAFRLLQTQSKYEEAGQMFTQFTHQYPKDPLIGNAYYWLGETHYVRRDYVKAADSFRQGYETMPTGPKAGENLFKLGMALEAQNKDKEACIVFRQVTTKFATGSSGLKSRADQEINRIGCN